jgi:hypothetical protein
MNDAHASHWPTKKSHNQTDLYIIFQYDIGSLTFSPFFFANRHPYIYYRVIREKKI